MSSDQWFYAHGGQQQGPVSALEFRDLNLRAIVGPATLVWTEGLANWVAAGTVQELLATRPADAAFTPGEFVPYYTPANALAPAYAGFWLRVVAYIIDYIITYIAGLIIGWGVGAGIGMLLVGVNPRSGRILISSVAALLGLITTWLYFALMEASSHQATVGKMALGIRVTDLAGGRITFGRATGRYFGKFISALILGIGFLMVIGTTRKQALHDSMAGTLVVKKQQV